ncbi:solute carrier family 25 member 35-like isoform X2 [Ctenocephalides felis]|nr:solute carrier family 25 member 35-like isoform X2 [Ctenocephalides felis]
MQLQGELHARGSHAIHYKNFAHAFITIAKTDGVLALQNGLVPALWFQLFLNGFRLGTYQICDTHGLTKDKNGNSSVIRSMAIGALGGAIGASSGSPFYLIKTQLQSKAAAQIAVGHQHSHENMTSALYKIFKQSGIIGLYRGVSSAIPRAAVGSSVQLVTFAKSKEILRNNNILNDSPLMISFVASMMGGTLMSLAMTPFDVIATRLYNQGLDAHGRPLLYNGILDCIYKMCKTEGIYGFYKGFWPSYLRLGPHTVLVLVFWDQIKLVQKAFQTTTSDMEENI